ncbi:16820_t:CDS:2 [Acaulospora morrowiae]|uniref:16820_t:CDS:1 n=1 Tax=Acaulospora morrowiae TaxID=94023 RepID=A0A9N8VEB3_9GLOM|nr:16820_t:CDS:2 [Acaulospora morrowiae]
MDPQRCHHCGYVGHKKFDCTERCRVGCKWCESPPARRPPAMSKNSLESQQRSSGTSLQRNPITLPGSNGGQGSGMQIGQNRPQIGPTGVPLGPANVQIGGPGALQLSGLNVPPARPQNIGPLPPSLVNQALRPLVPQPLGSTWPLIQQTQHQQPQQQVQHPSPLWSHPMPSPQTMLFQQPQPLAQFPQSQIPLTNSDNSSTTQSFIPNWNNVSVQQPPHVSLSGFQVDQQHPGIPGKSIPETGNDCNNLPSSKVDHQVSTSVLNNDAQNEQTKILSSNKSLFSTQSLNEKVPTPFQERPQGDQQNSNQGNSISNTSSGQQINGESREKDKKEVQKDERKYGDTSIEIINKLKLLKSQIELGIHSTVKPPNWVSSAVKQFPFNTITPKNEQNINVNGTNDSNKFMKNGRLDHLVKIKLEENGIITSKKKSPSLEDRSIMSSNTISPEGTSNNRFFMERRSRSPHRLPKEKIIRDRMMPLTSPGSDYNSPSEFHRLERYQRNKSRSQSPRRDHVRGIREYTRSASPGKHYSREFDDRYYSRNSGLEYREKYYSRPSGIEFGEKYCQRSMSLAPYEDYYSRYSEKHEERGNPFRAQTLPRTRSRSPTVYHLRTNFEDHPRRMNGTNGWYGDESFDRDYQVRPGGYYDLSREERYEPRDRSFNTRPEGERGYGDREFARPMEYEFSSRRRPNERW